MLDIGYSPSFFWELSVGEIHDIAESYVRKKESEKEEKERNIKDQILISQGLAIMVSDNIKTMFVKGYKPSELHEIYPGLFEPLSPQTRKEQSDLDLHKARMEDYVFRYNMTLKKKGGD